MGGKTRAAMELARAMFDKGETIVVFSGGECRPIVGFEDPSGQWLLGEPMETGLKLTDVAVDDILHIGIDFAGKPETPDYFSDDYRRQLLDEMEREQRQATPAYDYQRHNKVRKRRP